MKTNENELLSTSHTHSKHAQIRKKMHERSIKTRENIFFFCKHIKTLTHTKKNCKQRKKTLKEAQVQE